MNVFRREIVRKKSFCGYHLRSGVVKFETVIEKTQSVINPILPPAASAASSGAWPMKATWIKQKSC
jgi:hypothetical protein